MLAEIALWMLNWKFKGVKVYVLAPTGETLMEDFIQRFSWSFGKLCSTAHCTEIDFEFGPNVTLLSSKELNVRLSTDEYSAFLGRNAAPVKPDRPQRRGAIEFKVCAQLPPGQLLMLDSNNDLTPFVLNDGTVMLPGSIIYGSTATLSALGAVKPPFANVQ